MNNSQISLFIYLQSDEYLNNNGLKTHMSNKLSKDLNIFYRGKNK